MQHYGCRSPARLKASHYNSFSVVRPRSFGVAFTNKPVTSPRTKAVTSIMPQSPRRPSPVPMTQSMSLDKLDVLLYFRINVDEYPKRIEEMIRGIGVDVIEIERFRRLKEKAEFLRQILTDHEILISQEQHSRDHYCATTFAIKEAVLKALGIGLHHGSYWHNVEITKGPSVMLSGYIEKLVPQTSCIHVSTAHTRRYVVALVVIEQRTSGSSEQEFLREDNR